MLSFAQVAATHQSRPDSVLVESPLPGGVATVVRFIFQVPRWIQIGGAVVGALVAVAVVVFLWRRRRAMLGWLTSRSREVKIAMAVGLGVVLIGAAGAGTVSWNYMQHDNDFCTGCHVMGPAYERFTASEHDSLSCHNCHQQSLYASSRQLVLWVLERPQDIPSHAKVPNARCEACHVTGQPEVWQHIASTAGHRTHLESDSSALKDIKCVTCHGLEVHSFVPVDSTCAQAGCHIDVRIELGPMANQTSLHCATCHEFTAEVPLLATRDSAAGTLVPDKEQCLGCHEMQEVLAEFDVARDPHGGTCGMCHNPHTQKQASDAAQTCTSANCHIDWRAEPFHTGANHRGVAERCLTCHIPHRASLDASGCAECHQSVVGREDVPRAIRDRLRRALPFDTAAAARRVGLGWGIGLGDRVSTRDAPIRTPTPAAVSPPDSFPHARHTTFTCITCHTTRDGTAGLVFEQPRGCALCHHQDGLDANCRTCHVDGGPAAPRTAHVTVTVAQRGPVTREVLFRHAAHADVACRDCHTNGVRFEAGPDVRACEACHADHHTAARNCATCHVGAGAAEVHAPPADAHIACATCHARDVVRTLVPDRSFCLTCHDRQRADHHVDRQCTTCHMLATPDAWRRHLRETTR